MPFVLPISAFVMLVAAQSSLPEPLALRQRLTAYISAFPFVERGRDVVVSRALTTGFWEYLRALGPSVGQRLLDFRLVATLLPSVVLSLIVTWLRIRRWRSAGWIAAGAVVVCLAPLGLLLIAFDTIRIWTYTQAVALTTVWTVWRRGPEQEDRARLAPWLIGSAWIAVVATNLLVATPLMDHEVERFSTGGRILLYTPSIAAIAWWTMRRQARASA